MNIEDALDYVKFLAPVAGPDAIDAATALKDEIDRLVTKGTEDYHNLVTLLRKRFPANLDGSLPDWKIEEVLIENDRLKDSLFAERDSHGTTCTDLALAKESIAGLEQWTKDLLSGKFVNCVYCGHRYGPKGEAPEDMADVLKLHISTCSKHPLSKAVATLKSIAVWDDEQCSWLDAGVRARGVAQAALKDLA